MKKTKSNFKYKAEDIMEKVKNLQKLSESTNQQLIWIASISLLVGGIGVMNIMLVSVTERTSEIGLEKKLSEQVKKVILGQFLTEASVLTSIGGIIGVVLGIILSKNGVSGVRSTNSHQRSGNYRFGGIFHADRSDLRTSPICKGS